MSRMRKEKKGTIEHPTIFVLDGEMKQYEEGSMLELHMQLQQEEWLEIVNDTIRFKIFIECLKETAFPILNETWTEEDDWWRLQLDVAVSRMRNIDPMVFIPIDQDKIKTAFTAKMKTNAAEVVEEIKKLRTQAQPEDNRTNIPISDL